MKNCMIECQPMIWQKTKPEMTTQFLRHAYPMMEPASKVSSYNCPGGIHVLVLLQNNTDMLTFIL